jgi:PKD repeat protein
MRKIFTIFIAFICLGSKIQAQGDCSSATIVCGNTQAFNPSGVGQVWEQLACGGVEHNSQWIAFQAQASGTLSFTLRPYTLDGLPSALDFDWTLYQLPGSPNTSNCNGKVALQCNYAAGGTVLGVPGGTGLANPPLASSQYNQSIQATAGTWYALHIDQFSNTTPQVVSVQFTGSPESPFLNSSPGIFANEPNFSFASAGCGNAFNFTNTSTSTVGIALYLWDFGDGTTSTETSPSKTFLQPGTYYVTLKMIDNNGCATYIKKGVTYAITNPTLTAANIFVTGACTNSNNGTLTINYNGDGNNLNGVSGGTPSYTYELVNPSPMIRPSQASNVFTGLQPGIYTVKVTDACGRSATTTVTIAQIATNSAMSFTASIFQASCASSPTGSVYLNVSGSVPPYTLESIAPSATISGPFTAIQLSPTSATYSYNFTNLAAGTYIFRATDACGKVNHVNVTIGVSTAPILTSIQNSPSCNNTPTGSITVNGTGGTPGGSGNGSPGAFQYALITPSPIVRPFQNSSVFEGLLPGTYRVSVKDACGNEASTTTSIAASTAPTMGTHFTTPSCPNGTTGTLEVNVTASNSGGGPLTYELIAPSQQLRAPQTNNTFTGLPPGSYTIKLTNNCGLSATSTATIAAATAPSFNTTLVASCSTPANGSIQVNPATTGIAPFTFSLISPSTQIASSQGSNIANTTNSIFKNLPQGSYTVQMIDGCGSPVTNVVTIAAPSALVATSNATIASCAASATGQLSVVVPATGSAPYTYELIAPSPTIRPAQNSNVFNTLSAGANYTVRITDACGTQITNAVSTIATVAAPSLTVTNTGSCATPSSGTITAKVNAQGGGGPYQFALIAPSPVTAPNQTSPIFTGLPNGAYTVQITDACGVTATTTTTLATATPTPTASAFLNGCSGSAYVYRIIVTPQNFTSGGPVQGGGGPYTYALYDAANTALIQGPQVGPIFNGVPAGVNYTVRLTDACGTTGTVAVTTTTTPAALAEAAITATQLSCASTANGIITAPIATGGLPPYRYSLIDPAGPTVIQGPQTDLIFTGVPALASGYQVRVTDACGNTANSATLAFTALATLPAVTTTVTASCAAGTNGTVTAAVSTFGGGGNYQYTLLNAAGTTTIAGPQANPQFTGLAQGTYTVRITDACGSFSSAVGNAIIGAPAALTSAATASMGTCTGGSSGVVTGSSTGGVAPITFSLVDNATSTVVQGPQSNNVFSGVAAGTYLVRATDACGTITNSATATIANLTTAPTLTNSLALRCDGTILSGYGNAGAGAPFTYAICTGAACTSYGTYTTANQFTLTPGTYRISVRDKCGNTTNSADIVITTAIKPSISAITLNNDCSGADVTAATVNANGALGIAQYSVNNAAFTTALPTAITPGCKNIKVRYLNGSSSSCESDVLNFLVHPAATLSPVTFINCNTGAGTLDVVASAAAPPTDFAWEYSLDNATWQASPTFTGIALGTSGTVYIRSKYTGTVCANGTTGCLRSIAFTAPNTCSVVAFEGLEIYGEVTKTTNTIYWSTLAEIDNNRFVVQKSTNGIDFSSIGVVNTKAVNGNSSSTLQYSFEDVNPRNGKEFYRLQIVDNNNNFKFSKIITLKRGVGKLEIVDVYPNPTKDIIRFNVTGDKKYIKIRLTDIEGRVVIVNSTIQNNSFSLDLSNLASAMYILEATDIKTNEKTHFKIIKR